jgi:hypothetical protein
LTACAARSELPVSLSTLTELRVVATITPGKPDAPTEKISLTSSNTTTGVTWYLHVIRQDAQGKLLKEGSAFVAQPAVAAVWNAIESGKVRMLRPQPVTQQAFDFGERSLSLQWRAQKGEVSTHSISWDHPLAAAQEAALKSLLSELGRLARQEIPTVVLSYFPRIGG